MNLYQLFRETAARQGNSPALLGPQGDAALSYHDLDAAICATSDQLTACGVRPGQCVGLHLPSSPDYIIGTYALWRSGACVVPLPMELAAAEKSEICRTLSLDWAITGGAGAAFLDPFRWADAIRLNRSELVPLRSPAQHPPGFAALNSAFIRFTSGTTGSSKGVVLTHETIDERIRGANAALAIGPRDRILWVLSMSYHFTVSIVAYLTFGATIVLPANHFAAAITGSIERHSATLLYASPVHYALLAEYPLVRPLSSLRLAISTTSSLDGRVAARFAERYERPISQALGIIEVGLPCINVDPNPQRWDSVGRVLPPYRLRLEDAGLGPELQEVLLGGPGLLDAYYQPWQTRDQIMPDGWFRTGDVGHVDGDGYLFLRGRSKDVICVMGMKFFPQEVERVLATHPHVEAASVFGRADGRCGETVCARVVTGDCADRPLLERELRRYCRERLASYKVPEQIELVSALPRTASGKILHRAG
ncbi:MAG: acyl--CoA ligase [Planctomycetaceae bacterium]|nr:acyl--CoA ligase [Planctomycetaceae bacterium]